MAQPKYAARFLNFFTNLRLNRAEFADMAAFTLTALRANPKYKALADELEQAIGDYRTTHAGQLSGESQGATITLAQAMADFKAWVKKVERKYIIPTYDDNSADYKALLPNGRSALTGSSQTKVEDAFTAFLDAMEDRPIAFPAALLLEARNPADPNATTILSNLRKALKSTDKAKKDSGDRKVDLHDGRLATCVLLFKAYATLLLEYFENPKKVAPFFDLSKAETGGGKAAKLPEA